MPCIRCKSCFGISLGTDSFQAIDEEGKKAVLAAGREYKPMTEKEMTKEFKIVL